jgi:cell wall-associated NlpC family hydrolase
MNTIPIDRAELVRLMKSCFSFKDRLLTYIKYRLGAKARMAAVPVEDFRSIDCSGFVRWLVYNSTHGEVLMPDGSWHQQEWVKSQGFKRTDYKYAGLNDSRVRIAFINTKGKKVGHVWLIVNSQTIESYSGRGAGRRPWNTPVLLKNVDACYVLSDPI